MEEAAFRNGQMERQDKKGVKKKKKRPHYCVTKPLQGKRKSQTPAQVKRAALFYRLSAKHGGTSQTESWHEQCRSPQCAQHCV